MLTKGWNATIAVAVLLGATLFGCGDGTEFQADVLRVNFETLNVPPADAGRLYNHVVAFSTEGGAALPDQFELSAGVLPPGVTLDRDREDVDQDGLPDEDGAYTGNARLLGVPRERGSYSFTIRAISTGALDNDNGQPDLAVTQQFSVLVGEGTVAILTPTSEEGTSDPAVPAFPAVIPFVNPANPQAFFAWPFLIAGGSNNNINTIYMPRELELSAFDVSVVDETTLHQDTDENLTGSAPSKWEPDFSDGGIFTLQAGQQKVQLGGFQSPRGPVVEDTDDDGVQDTPFMTGLLTDWFQEASVPKNSRRDFADSQNLATGDDTLGTSTPVLFTDYFSPGFEATWAPNWQAKYPFTADQYVNAFWVPFVSGVDITPLMYRVIVEAIDTRGTPATKTDDVIARKAFVVRVQIPDIKIDTAFLPAGQAGVPYSFVIALSGGVPPLFADLEWVDGTNDLTLTASDPLTKDLFGVEIDPKTWQFIGAPRAAAPDLDPSTPSADGPAVDVTIRAYAQVMNPIQDGAAQVPTGGTGEFDGTSTLTGKSGRHKTIPWNVELPTAPSITNVTIAAGRDGFAYPGDRIAGAGGVPLLAPYPPGFFDGNINAIYPTATARTSYEWDSEYTQDTSPGHTPGAVVPGMPKSLTLVTSASLATNGNISGTTTDRGFLPIRFMGVDFYVGLSNAVDPTAHQQAFEKTLTLSVSPDTAVYVRGVQASEGTGGAPTGLADSTNQMAQPLMSPLLLAGGLFSVETGGSPTLSQGMSGILQFDTLPVMLANCGSDSHNTKSRPTVTGFWPAESNKQQYWNYTWAQEGWKHLQQEFTWIQAPNASHTRVFLWAEATTVSSWTNGTWTSRFQALDATKRRGVLVLSPFTGEFYVPAILDGNVPGHGTLFGAEAVVGGSSTSSTGAGYYYMGQHPYYTRYYYYAVQDSRPERSVHTLGTSVYLEPYSSSVNTSIGWYQGPLGRTATSIAMSADGIWCATALQGGTTTTPKILIWRTDGAAIPSAILANTAYVTPLDGKRADGSTFANSAAIISPGGQSAQGQVVPVGIATNHQLLLPDSLMFVKDGLLFLMQGQLQYVFGVSLTDGHLSALDLVNQRAVVPNNTGAGLGPAPTSTGQFIPDQDWLRGGVAPVAVAAQFAFAGCKPIAGEEGPDKIAFVAGQNAAQFMLPNDLGSSYPRQGVVMQANRDKSLFFAALGNSGGLDLDSSTLRDLTGSSSAIYGDLLSPGRFGEEMDFVAVSDDGKYAAVVREVGSGTSFEGSTSFSYRPTFHTGLYYAASNSTYASWGPASHDILLLSTDGSDMHSGTNQQHVLFMGTGSATSTGDPTVPGYAIGKAHLNAYSRRINGVTFTPDSKTLIFNYAGNNSYSPLYSNSQGSSTGWGPINQSQTGTFGMGVQVSVSLTFRTSADAAIDFNSASNFRNNLTGLTGVSNVGSGAPFGQSSTVQSFWATFKSENGNFLYMISDQIDSSLSFTTGNRNFMVGFNISSSAINGRDPFTPFIPHGSTIGFEQFDVNSFNYEFRFASVPGGVTFNGRDGAGILCVIASDASSGAGSATDLEVYVMDANRGTSMVALTSAVTTGTANAINHLYMSADGNVLAGQICRTTTATSTSRAILNSNTDLFVVTNIHQVLAGATPTCFIVSQAQSHGATLAFVGEGTGSGPQALLYSSGASSTANTSWSTRTLKSVTLAPGSVPTTIDSTQSHYAVLSGGRKLNDDPNSGG